MEQILTHLKNFAIMASIGSTSILSLVLFAFVRIYPPKHINPLYGYRTVLSMKNPGNWAFAQRYSAKLAFVASFVALLFQLLFLFLFGSSIHPGVVVLLLVGIWLPGIAWVFYKTERELKKFEKSNRL